MMITEKKIGRPTMRQAGMTISRVSPVIFWCGPKWAVRWCVAFSTITIAWSTRMPIEMAMPESDMMFEAMLKCRMRMNDTSTARGRVMQISTALRKCIRISRIASEAIIISSRSVSVSVSIAPWISRVRS